MRKKLGMMAAVAAMVAGDEDVYDVYNFYGKAPLVQLQGVTIASSPVYFGLYRAGARAHKRYLRKNHLGKFRKRK